MVRVSGFKDKPHMIPKVVSSILFKIFIIMVSLGAKEKIDEVRTETKLNLLIHSINRFLLSNYYMQGLVLDSEVRTVNKTDQNL